MLSRTHPREDICCLSTYPRGFSPEETVLVGDRLYTDIACGVNAGISTIFVLSGEGTLEDVASSEKKPEYIYKNIREIYEDIS